MDSKKRKFPLVFFLLVSSLFVLGVFGIFSSSDATANLEKTASGYFDAIKAKEYTKAYYDYTSKDFQKETTLDAFKKGIRGYTLFEDAGSIQFNTRQADDEGNGYLQGIVKSVHGAQAPISLYLVK
jgi:hypothetical protein